MQMLPLPFIILLLNAIIHVSTFGPPDTCCTTGIKYNNVCCAKSCGKCGGDECDGYQGGERNCCPDTIIQQATTCNDIGPPCIITTNCLSESDIIRGIIPPPDISGQATSPINKSPLDSSIISGTSTGTGTGTGYDVDPGRYNNYGLNRNDFDTNRYDDRFTNIWVDTNNNNGGKNGDTDEERVDFDDLEDYNPYHAPYMMYGRTILIEVTACEGWHYASTSNSLQLQLKGEHDSTRFFYVNKFTTLPTYGESYVYYVNVAYYDIYGNLVGVLVSMDDMFGYCLAGLSIILLPYFDYDSDKIFDNIDSEGSKGTFDQLFPHLVNKTGDDETTTTAGPGDFDDHGGRYNFYHGYFGLGVFFTKYCKYSFVSLTPQRIMPWCNSDYFDLYVNAPKAVYKIVPHTCIHPESGIQVLDMVGNLYHSVMGTVHTQNVYIATDIIYMDHFQVGYIDLHELGHIVGGNVMIDAYSNHNTHPILETYHYDYAFYSRNVHGKIIGIKLEAVGYTPHNDMYFHEMDTYYMHIKIGGYDKYIHSVGVLGYGQYLVAFLDSHDRIYVDKSTQIIIYGEFTQRLYLNVFVIFEGFTHYYKLPWIVEEYHYIKPPTTHKPTQEYTPKPTKEYTEYTPKPTIGMTKYSQRYKPTYKPVTTTGIPTTSTTTTTTTTTSTTTADPTTPPPTTPPPTTKSPTDYAGRYNPRNRIGRRLREQDDYKKEDSKDYNDYKKDSKDDYDNDYKKDENYKEENGISWFEANQYCDEKYGTFLASVHSSDEEFLLNGFIGSYEDDRAWIGFFDWDINNPNGCHHFYGSFNGEVNDDGSFYRFNCDWKWIDRSYVDYTDWAINSPNRISGNDCGYISGHYKRGWENINCETRDYIRKYACLTGWWYPNHLRKFDHNSDQQIKGAPDAVVLISLGNDNPYEAICFDSVSVDTLVQIDITVNWIGGHHLNSYLNVLYRLPVCETETIRMEIDYATSKSRHVPADIRIPFGICWNEGRMGQMAECYVDQFYTITANTKFRLGDHYDELKYLSFASPSRITLSTGQSKSFQTKNEYRMKKKWVIWYVDNGPNGTYVRNNWRQLVLTPEHYWSNIYEDIIYEEYNDYNISFRTTQIWERRAPMAIHCFGEAYIPAEHSLSYEAIINTIRMQVNVRADLKLRLCEDFINEALYNEDTAVVYLNDVPAQITHWEPITCALQWHAAEYIPNTITCVEQQQLSISLRLSYLPRCLSTNAQLYDGCQCNLGRDVCWCVDPQGNKIGAQARQIPPGITYAQTCVQLLNCSNSEVTYP